MFLAIIAIMTFVPYVGYITLPIGSVQLIAVPVILGALLYGYKNAVAYASFFGVTSMIKAMTMASNPIDQFFINPIISVFPRLLFGLFLGFCVHLFNKSRFKNNFFAIGIFTAILTLSHTIFVAIFFTIFTDYTLLQTAALFYLFGLLEALFTGIIVPIIYLRIIKINNKTTNLDNK